MEEKKLHILKNVGALYMKYGIRSVTMDDVAQEFGISKKTLYQLFSNKEALVSQTIDYHMQNPMFEMGSSKHGNAIEQMIALRDHVSNVIKHYNNNLEFDLRKLYPQLHKRLYDFKRQKIYENMVQNLTQGIEENFYRKELDTNVIAKLQVGRMLCTLNPDNGIFSEKDILTPGCFDKIIDYHLHAICTKSGLAEYKQQLLKANINTTK